AGRRSDDIADARRGGGDNRAAVPAELQRNRQTLRLPRRQIPGVYRAGLTKQQLIAASCGPRKDWPWCAGSIGSVCPAARIVGANHSPGNGDKSPEAPKRAMRTARKSAAAPSAG